MFSASVVAAIPQVLACLDGVIRLRLRRTVSALIAKQSGPASVRRTTESWRGYDATLWKTLCEQVGAAALIVPEREQLRRLEAEVIGRVF